jgi:hypothetical protein
VILDLLTAVITLSSMCRQARLQEEVEDGITNFRNSVNLLTRWGGEQLTTLMQQVLLKRDQVRIHPKDMLQHCVVIFTNDRVFVFFMLFLLFCCV